MIVQDGDNLPHTLRRLQTPRDIFDTQDDFQPTVCVTHQRTSLILLHQRETDPKSKIEVKVLSFGNQGTAHLFPRFTRNSPMMASSTVERYNRRNANNCVTEKAAFRVDMKIHNKLHQQGQGIPQSPPSLHHKELGRAHMLQPVLIDCHEEQSDKYNQQQQNPPEYGRHTGTLCPPLLIDGLQGHLPNPGGGAVIDFYQVNFSLLVWYFSAFTCLKPTLAPDTSDADISVIFTVLQHHNLEAPLKTTVMLMSTILF